MMNGNGLHTGNWYLVQTRSMSEYTAAAAMEKHGYELYFPRMRTPKPRRGHDDTPLFPGYLFVKSDKTSSRLPSIQTISGLIGWVQFDGIAPSIPDKVISELDKRLNLINQTGGYWTRFRRGEQVRVSSGMMDTLAEILEEPKSPESTAQVLLNFMGRLVPTRVPWQDLRSIGDGEAISYLARPPRRTRGRKRWIHGFGPSAVTDTSPSHN